MVKIILVMCLVMCFGAGPATATSQPSGIPRIMAELRAQIESLKADLESLQKENADLHRRIEQFEIEKRASQEADTDPIAAAIRTKRLAIGMTLQQACRAIRDVNGPYLREETETVKVYEWGGNAYWWRATFRAGKIESFEHSR